MITTFVDTMQPSASLSAGKRWPAPIIAVRSLALIALFALLAGCSMIKFGYGQAGPFVFRWLDRYVEFDDAQSLRVRTALDDSLAWHRRTQLPDYADLLARAQAEVAGDVSPERMCSYSTEVRARIDTLVRYLVPAVAEVASTVTPAQIASIEKRYAETNDDYRDDYVQRDRARRLKAAVKREIERAETFYGSVDDAQRELIARSVAASPFDAEQSFAERQRRQQDALAVVRRLAANKAGREDAEAQVRAYLQRVERSPREAYRGYSERLLAYNCEFASALHNATTQEQRRAAAKKLRGWELDLRSLAGDAAS